MENLQCPKCGQLSVTCESFETKFFLSSRDDFIHRCTTLGCDYRVEYPQVWRNGDQPVCPGCGQVHEP